MSASAIPSNAFNFQSYLSHGVDPRTGQYTLSLTIPPLKNNYLAGPDLPLVISFNPMNPHDSGFGIGWGMALSEYAPQTRMLALSTGESFKVTGPGDTIKEKKLDSFHFETLADDLFRVVHRSGTVELLRSYSIDNRVIALPEEVLGADGRGLRLEYETYKGRRCLERVSDASGVLLNIVRDTLMSTVEIRLAPGQGVDGRAVSEFVLKLDGKDHVSEVRLPSGDGARWKLAYEDIRGFLCLTDVWTPTGAHEQIRYGERNDNGHAFPGGLLPPLPRVTSHVVRPGLEQPDIEVRYAYKTNNFLGHGALPSWSDTGEDKLYEVADPEFRYGSTATLWVDGAARRTVQRDYNRFHLMTDEVTLQGACRKRMVTTYYADDPEYKYKPFDEQLPQCQMPMRQEMFWERTDNNNLQHKETSETRFDEYGNLTEKFNADGTREVMTYYDAAGESGLCPPDPEGFTRRLRSRAVHPAASAHGNAAVLHTEYHYVELPPVQGHEGPPLLVEHTQVLTDAAGTELQRMTTEYFNDPSDPVRHGRPRSLGDALNGLASFTDYTYEVIRPEGLNEDLLRITETLTSHDRHTLSLHQEVSLRTGEVLRSTDLEGVEMHRVYDDMGRLVSETASPGTAFAATREYAYHLVGGDAGGAAWQQVTDAKGVKTRTHYDGLSRVILEEAQDLDAPRIAGLAIGEVPFRPTYKARYDAMDQRVAATQVDWLEQVDLELTTRHTFDDWGEAHTATGPDGVTQVTEVTPFGENGPVQYRWQESSDATPQVGGKQVMYYNRFNKADKLEFLDADGKVIFTQHHLYDGLGQCVESREEFSQLTQVTAFTYDLWRRVLDTTLPDGTVMTQRFALHSTDELVEQIRVKPANIELPERIAGEQTFDGLDRLVSRHVGGRHQAYTYAPGSRQPETFTLHSGKQVAFEYETQLGGGIPRRVTEPDDDLIYRHDGLTGQLLEAENEHGTRRYAYGYRGQVTQERWSAKDGDEHASHHVISRLGRQIQRRDTGSGTSRYAQTTRCEYDAAGRLTETVQGVLRATCSYDSFGREHTVTTTNALSGQTLSTALEYDFHSRETLRTLTVGGEVFTVHQTWRGDSQLESRHLQHGGRSVLAESFFYDRRGRLQRHECSGEQLPQDRFGNEIVRQVFTYDALDNITKCTSMFADTSTHIADYVYATDDPCQLKQIEHKHASYPELETFSYDTDGNLTNDHEGRTLRYDSLGRLLAMISASGEQRSYVYDGQRELTGILDTHTGQTLCFFQGNQLHHTVNGSHSEYVLYANAKALAHADADDSTQTRLLLCTAIGSVIGQARQDAITTTSYSAYGETGAGLASLLGFNGELHEAGGWYLLGRGYRAYSTILKRFNRPDSESPFGKGGLNPYVYCQGNPVRFRDPTGHWREVPEYYYPPPPPPPPEEPKGGWLKWIGVAVAAVFVVVSLVSAPWSAGLTSAAMAMAFKGAAIQLAGVGLAVVGALVDDPTVQMLTMLGGMALGMWGGAVSAKANALHKATKIAQEKANKLANVMTQTDEIIPPGVMSTPRNSVSSASTNSTYLSSSAPSSPASTRASFNSGAGVPDSPPSPPAPGDPGVKQSMTVHSSKNWTSTKTPYKHPEVTDQEWFMLEIKNRIMGKDPSTTALTKQIAQKHRLASQAGQNSGWRF